jgi:prepilin-type N-terminal cleavage/methylation domain-containing protein
MRTSQKPRGFTLTELLVVIAIIVILAALLFPVMQSARQKGREAACIANLHQLVIGLRTYMTDERLYPPPPSYDPTANSGKGLYSGGFSSLYPQYISDKHLLLCPEDFAGNDALGKASDGDNARLYSSYNGEVDFTQDMTDPVSWQFKTTSFNSEARFQHLYNYYGYSYDPATGQTTGYDLYSATDYPSPGNVDPNTGSNYLLPTWLSSEGLTWRFYPHLVNRYTPDNTIVTHCTRHRSNYGTDTSRQMDLVLRLGGEASRALIQPMMTPDATGVAPFVHQR